jgi:hypothetical protein
VPVVAFELTPVPVASVVPVVAFELVTPVPVASVVPVVAFELVTPVPVASVVPVVAFELVTPVPVASVVPVVAFELVTPVPVASVPVVVVLFELFKFEEFAFELSVGVVVVPGLVVTLTFEPLFTDELLVASVVVAGLAEGLEELELSVVVVVLLLLVAVLSWADKK